MILIVDNYDSFTYNLVQLLAPYQHLTRVVRNDALSADEAVALKPSAVILSPGPCTPDDAGICLDMVPVCAAAGVPLFGVCLGHQSIAQAYGATIIRAGRPMHGKVSTMTTGNDPLFDGIDAPFEATRYHSLSVDAATVPDTLEVLSEATDDGEIMALKVKGQPIYGVQFHPESYSSTVGQHLLGNFLQLAGLRAAA
ncbi:MAG: aminodeoxychorismate/anthranilate synthase component II [Parvularculaceae bacterium]|nr:aminodeoxychorismate/anthranilate synthase component II [Parvularculaceae bacterium]